jgi:hypothetical protein
MPVNLTVKKFSRGLSVLKEAEESQPPKEPKRRGRPPKNKEIFVKEELKPIPEDEPEEEFIVGSDTTNSDSSEWSSPDVNLDNSFLNDLNKNNYKEEVEEEVKQEAVEPKPKAGGLTQAEEIMHNLFEENKQIARRKPKPTKQGYDNDIYSDNPTPLLGKDKRILLSKLNQYKLLFPEELKKFKIKPNCSIDDLQNALKECEVIVETNSLEVFLTDSILQCLKLIEGGSTLTRFDITGLSDNLKKNEQFHKLCKQLYVKYQVFSKLPPEYSLMILVATTAYTCTIVNQRKKELNRFLDEPLINTQNQN